MACLIMTLEEMLKLALGTTPLDHVQVQILHSFLKIVIEKLKIQTDFVEISGPEVKNLREMLCQAHNPLVNVSACSSENILKEPIDIVKMEEEINKLTKTINKMEADLREHLDAVKRCKQTPAANRLQLRKPKYRKLPDEESFSSDCEDLCVPCDEKNLIACDLLQNQTFLKKLMRLVTSPVIDRVFEFEKSIAMLNEKFQNFLNTAEDEYRKVPLIEDCLLQITAVKEELDRHQIEFIETMEEVQDMMDTKLDKIHIPALKKYITDRMTEIEKKLAALIEKEQCPKAAGVIMTNLQCLCCTTKVCQKDKVHPIPILADVKLSKREKTNLEPQHFCIPHDRPRSCGGNHTVLRPSEKTLQKSNLLDDFGDQMNLPHDPARVKYFRGHHGRMYRSAPKADNPFGLFK